jgi:hypothetical protein
MIQVIEGIPPGYSDEIILLFIYVPNNTRILPRVKPVETKEGFGEYTKPRAGSDLTKSKGHET